MHPEHIRYHSVCPICVVCWHSRLGGVVLHRVDVLQLCKHCFCLAASTLLSTHADGQSVNISFTVCFVFCCCNFVILYGYGFLQRG